MFDTHVHLNQPDLYKKIDLVIKNAQESGVKKMLVVGYDIETSKRAIEIANKYSFIYAAIGVHPCDLLDASVDYISEIERMISSKVVAIGEIGLDYYWKNVEKDTQKKYFIEFIKLAYKYKLPIVVHNRDAMNDMNIIFNENKQFLTKGILHCYGGSKEMIPGLAKLGMYFSYGGPVTFLNARNVAESAKNTPIDRILVETDSPYLSPHPYRGKENEPKNVRLVVNKLAELFNISEEKMSEITYNNAMKVLGIIE